MANSFTVGGLELIGATTNPEYRLAKGMDGGAITPDTVTISSLSLDGEIVSGRRTTNKAWSFTVAVNGADRLTLARNVDTLLAAVAADDVVTLPVVWTPSGCPSTNFTAFRATATPQKNMVMADQGYVQVLIEFATGPFGESSVAQVITVPATGGAAQLQVDGMNSGSFTGASLDTTTKYEGAGSAAVQVTQNASGQYASPATVGRTVTSTDLSTFATVGVRVRVAQVPPVTTPDMGVLGVVLTLTSTGGGTAVGLVGLNTRLDGPYYLAQFALGNMRTSTSPAFNPAAVISWNVALLTASRQQSFYDPTSVTVWLDDLRAFPPGSVSNSTAEGGVLTIPGVLGSARTPVALLVTRAPTLQSSGNLLSAADSSFETGTTGTWTGYGTLSVVTTQALQGTHSLQSVMGAGAGTTFISTASSATMMAVCGNCAYTLTGSVRASAATRQFTLTVDWYSASGALISTSSTAAATDSASAWTTLAANVTSPSNAAFADIRFVFTAPGSTETHYFDAVGLISGTSKPWVIGTGTYASTATLSLTNALIHFPPADQDPDATILAGLSAGSVTIPAANINYDDTFSVAVLLTATAGIGISRVITVTITQKLGAATVATQTLTATVVGVQTIASISQAGQQVTLPLLDIPAENTNSSIVIAVSSTNGSDTFSDVALCSTSGQTILLTGLATTNTAIYVDKPDPTVGIGPVYASATDRTQATSAMPNLAAYVGPPQLEPGNNRVLVASTNGAPGLIATLNDRWLDEALV